MGSTSKHHVVNRYIGAVYFGALLINVAGQLLQQVWLVWISKPVLMLLLITWIVSVAPPSRFKWLVILALFFSWLGDCLLLFENRFTNLFIPALVSFLLTHLIYIYFFRRERQSQAPRMKNFGLLMILCLLYGLVLLITLLPVLGSLKIPVVVYAVVILTMLVSALHAYTSFPGRTGQLFVMGALLFVLSDSLLALNKFLIPLDQFSISIMITYAFAQWLITKGFLDLPQNKNPRYIT